MGIFHYRFIRRGGYNSQFTIKTTAIRAKSILQSCIVHCALCIAVFISSCSSCNKKIEPQPATSSSESVAHNAPAFNADSAYAFVKAQVDFGPRVPNTKSHDACAEYLISKAKSY